MNGQSNRLINETSPYLLQHAHNPVDWYPWGSEALDRAKNEDKPILISIGYSACHWCHVMERESFENDETAQLMNEHFINIKIDREERPDLDHIYMDAVQAMTGSGGWPLNVFLLPDGKPFYGGTYFPPQRAYSRSSWTEILHSVKDAYQNKKHELESQAYNITEHLKKANEIGTIGGNQQHQFDEKSLEDIAAALLKNADKIWGGFGGAPKFPQTFSIQYLLRNYYFTNHEDSLKQALLSLNKMIYGGINDQLGGGFARYSTDDKWLAPHFEKMLYDNALLLNVLCEAYQLTNLDLYKNCIENTLAFVQAELMNEEGGFYSALDADSEGIEGKFYTWSQIEVAEILESDAPIFCKFYGVSEDGNWEHTNILWITKSLEEFADENNLDKDVLNKTLGECKSKLIQQRNKRIRPQLDDKILLGWNALMNIACCKAYAATGHKAYKALAEKNMLFLEKSFQDVNSGLWLHTYKNNIAKYPAFLDDYAYLIHAYIHLQEITANQDYLVKAKKITELVIENFKDEISDYFYYTGKFQDDVIIRKKEVYDGATPSGNAVMATCLYYLSVIFELQEWREMSANMVGGLRKIIVKHPSSFGVWSCLVQQLVFGSPELIVTGKSVDEKLISVLNLYIPNKIIQVSGVINDTFPLLREKLFGDDFLIYICKEYACQPPVKTAEEIKSLLK